MSAKYFRRGSVRRTADFRRIEGLPRRRWCYTFEQRQELSEALRPVGYAGGGFVLNEIQTAALVDIARVGGAFLPISVGAGKSLISLLAPAILQAERPILLVPAALRTQTKEHVIPNMGHHFRLHPNLRVIGYSELSLAKNDNMLFDIMPDCIIMDECHKVKNTDAGRTRRMVRYLRANPDTSVVAMSGTVSNRSIRDYAHILRWSLGLYGAPIPTRYTELMDWADALDEGVASSGRLEAGALWDLCEPSENPRQGYRRRLTETPGVVASGSSELGVSLEIMPAKTQTWDTITERVQALSETWTGPNGKAFSEAMQVWEVDRQLALGFWYEWKHPAPEGWLHAQRAWASYVRRQLSRRARGLDTPLQVRNDAAREGVPELAAWERVRDDFKPETIARWFDDGPINFAAAWLKRPGIVWVEHTAFGKRLAEVAGVPYFGGGPKASRDILTASGPLVASIHAHATGKNLQQWDRNLVVSPPPTGRTWEQLLGRTHRQGQKSDTVTVEVYQYTEGQRESFRKAQADAVYLEDSLGGRQRLNYADITIHGVAL